jgi:anti-sigma B factor antagonist
MRPFSCHKQRIDDSHTLVVCAGEIDLVTCKHLRETLEGLHDNRHGPRLVIDLSDVTFLDSAGLSTLIVEQRRAPEPLRIVVTKPALRKLFAVTRLEDVFSLHPSRDEALASFLRDETPSAEPVDEPRDALDEGDLALA